MKRFRIILKLVTNYAPKTYFRLQFFDFCFIFTTQCWSVNLIILNCMLKIMYTFKTTRNNE